MVRKGRKMTILDSIRNNVILSVVTAVEKKVDGREIAKDITEDVLVPNLGENVSLRMQREPITQFLTELVEGFWGDDHKALILRMESWIDNLKKRTDPML